MNLLGNTVIKYFQQDKNFLSLIGNSLYKKSVGTFSNVFALIWSISVGLLLHLFLSNTLSIYS